MVLLNDAVQRNGRSHDSAFRWAVGIESSCIPHANVDEYEWTQHNRYWREDFRRVADELGCRWMRYSLSWHQIEKTPGTYDWSWFDERLELARELGIELILDLIHFGVPAWLPDAFGDVDFPVALERFSREFGARYSGEIRSVCPINEPLITALFCGDVGLWPPHGRSLTTYMTVLSRVAQGLSRSIQALRESMKHVEIVLCDAIEHTSLQPDLPSWVDDQMRKKMEEDVNRRMQRRFIVADLITGRVDQEHPLHGWLAQHGFSAMDMNWFLRHPVEIDLLGLDYYAHSEIELFAQSPGHWRQRVPEKLAGLYHTAKDYWERYRIPMMLTETSCCGDDERRQEWLDFTVHDVRRFRKEGIPILGHTWWPLLDHMDWDGALLHQIGKIHRVGIYEIQRQPSGELRRNATSLVGSYAKLVAGGEESAGALTEQPRQPETYVRPKRAGTVRTQLDFPIIVHCHLRWGGVWQRPQQFLSRLSKNHRVLFVEGPFLVSEEIQPRFELLPVPEYPNVTIMQSHFPSSRFHDGGWVDEQRYRLLQQALEGPLASEFHRPVQWFYDPMAVVSFAGKLDESAIVYDCMDQLAQFKFAPPEIATREQLLLNQADVVFTGGRKLFEEKSRFNPNCHFYGCGVEVEHFATARAEETKVPPDLDFVERPILGYFGVVDERLDYDLITKLADANPGWSIVMIGPLAKIDPNALPCRRNLFWLGKRDYAQLPAYTKAFSVCLMPFALNEATEFINPTKALEYMATGRPVVSSAVPDVVSNFGRIVRVARSHEEFIERCRCACEQPDQERIQAGLQLADDNRWEMIVAALERHVKDVLDRRMARRPTREATASMLGA
jgi:beta-glucosidase/6-phospho-beta-glucosidase/beta-galactosidase/glycosyltransferase involved in cell wall biosynthesis